MERVRGQWLTIVAIVAIVATVATAATLSGCASGTTMYIATATPRSQTVRQGGPSLHAPRDYCALVTLDDVWAAIGLAVQSPQEHISVDANIGADADGPRNFTKLAACRYAAVRGPAVVALDYYYGLAPDVAAIYIDRRAQAHDPRAVIGLGDAAFWDGAALGVIRGAVFAQIAIQDASGLAPGSAALLRGERGLAMVIVGRL